MEFIGPEIEENGGNIKKAVETVGDYVSDVVWAEILQAALLEPSAEHQKASSDWFKIKFIVLKVYY